MCMDLNNLRKLSDDAHGAVEKQILQKCNPQSIAQELIRDLEKSASEAAKKGERRAVAAFDVFCDETVSNFKGTERKEKGPLVDFSDREKMSETLFRMVQKYVTDKNIKLELAIDKYNDSTYKINRKFIRASVEW